MHEEIKSKILKSNKDDLSSALNTITEREAKILVLRMGLFDEKIHSLKEVGDIFKVTRERIRQIEAKALRKLSHPSRESLLDRTERLKKNRKAKVRIELETTIEYIWDGVTKKQIISLVKDNLKRIPSFNIHGYKLKVMKIEIMKLDK